MKKIFAIIIFIYIILSSCNAKVIRCASPNGKNSIEFKLNEQGELYYSVRSSKINFIEPSLLGFKLKKIDLKDDFKLVSLSSKKEDRTWNTLWGEKSSYRNNYRELTLCLKQKKTGIAVNVVARCYDEGIAFRYVFPAQNNLKKFVIIKELTKFNFADDYKAWWAFADFNSYEKKYFHSSLSQIGDKDKFETRKDKEAIQGACNTPLLIKVNKNLTLSIHEADLDNYAEMSLKKYDGFKMESLLCPWLNGDAARLSTPCKTPWRTIEIAKNEGDLVASGFSMNLNPPCEFESTDWIKPHKYVGIWWEMHTGKSSWAAKTQFGKPLAKGREHGATTENTKKYIDFAAKYCFPEVLVEGWDKGWDDMTGSWTGYGIFDWKTPTDDYDIDEVCNYAEKKGVSIMMYHETISDMDHFIPAMDELFTMCNKYGMVTDKVGTTGDVNYDYEKESYRQYHHGQYMVNQYRNIVRKAAKYHIMVVNHEPIKFTGEQRTYPNLMAKEGARGQEYNAWSEGNSPEYGTVLPFTRLLSGPMDFTPGIFKMKVRSKKTSWADCAVHTTLCKQLAYYLTMYSPIQMAADLPENYEGNKAFKFICDVPTDWSDTKVLNAVAGDYYTVVRKEKGTDNWYLGSITDENSRVLSVDLSFLDKTKFYIATIYSDANDTSWDENPESYNIIKKKVTSDMVLKIKLARGGGQAIQFIAE